MVEPGRVWVQKPPRDLIPPLLTPQLCSHLLFSRACKGAEGARHDQQGEEPWRWGTWSRSPPFPSRGGALPTPHSPQCAKPARSRTAVRRPPPL